MKRLILFLLALGAVAAIASLGTRRLLSQSAPSISQASFTITIDEDFYRYGSGELGRRQTHTFMRRSDGSRVEQRMAQAPSGLSAEQKTVVDLGQKRSVAVDGLTQSATTYNLSDAAIHRYRSADVSCLAPNLPRMKFLGHEVVRTRERLPSPASEISEMESWRAPHLNCQPLMQLHYLSKGGSPLQLTNARRATAVTVGEPDPRAFEIPAGLTERAPSAVMEEFYRRHKPGEPCANCGKMEASDRAYSAHQK